MSNSEDYSDLITKELSLLDSRPLFDIEVSSRCNISCRFCPRDKMADLGTGLMEADTMDALTEWLPGGSSVLISGLGEPLLNPRLNQFVRKLRCRGLAVSIITNGILLTPNRFDELRDAGVCEVQLSAQTLSANHYQSEMAGSDFYKLLEHLKYLCEADRGNVRLRFNSILELEEWEKKEILRFCEENEFIPFLRKKHSRGGTIMNQPVERLGCGIFPSTTFINYQGGVMRCVNDRFGKTIGSIFTDSFQTIQERKRDIIRAEQYVPACRLCTDSYRWEIMDSMDVHTVKKTGGDV